MITSLLAIAAVLAVSIASLSGIGLLALGEKRIQRWMMMLVSFSTGALLGNVLLHMLPEMAEKPEIFERSVLVMLCGIVGSFILEKMLHWHHCHHVDHHHAHPVGVLTLVGDALHNAVDGMLIASAFLLDVRLGMVTTLTVLLHEIPQEIGDFSILLHSGYSRWSALGMNVLSALTAVAGAVLVLLTNRTYPNAIDWMLPFAAGNLLYIAGVDLLPELHKEVRLKETALQLFFLLLGIGLLYMLHGVEA